MMCLDFDNKKTDIVSDIAGEVGNVDNKAACFATQRRLRRRRNFRGTSLDPENPVPDCQLQTITLSPYF